MATDLTAEHRATDCLGVHSQLKHAPRILILTQIATRLNKTVEDNFFDSIFPNRVRFKSIKESLEHLHNKIVSMFDDEINICCTVYGKPTIRLLLKYFLNIRY